MTIRTITIIIFLWTLLFYVTHASRIDSQSFSPPYTGVDRDGKRLASPTWRVAGSAAVNENFIRLTPDQQSKKGALWSKRPLETNKFSSILTFRISGKGRKFFGDGLAIWIVKQQNIYIKGDFHGINEKFEGFGVIFDTFKNTETAKYHKDVSVVVNDKTRLMEDMITNSKGCDAKVRYHEDRADFSVTNSSRAKIVLDDLTLSIFIDEKNTGEWQECTKVDLPFKSGWSKQAYIGVSASTGQLSDNHDILSLVTFYDHKLLSEEDEASRNLAKFVPDEDAPIENRLSVVEDKLEQVVSKLETLKHHFEHELMSVEGGIENAIEKLQEQEKGSEDRLSKLETNVLGQVGSSVEERLEKLEGVIDRSIIHKLSLLEKQIDSKMTEHINQTVQSSSGWQLPFIFLILIIGISGISLNRWYRKLKKTHLL